MNNYYKAPGDYGEVAVARMCDHKVLSHQEETALFQRIEAGEEEARQTIIKHNLRLVAKVASKYHPNGLDFSDLFQEGITGLIRAVNKFDFRKGYKFSTYAIWWIRQAIMRGVDNNSRTIRLPSYVTNEKRLLEENEAVMVPLDKRLDNSPLSISDLIADGATGPDIIATERINKEQFLDTLEKLLNPREFKVIRQRFWQNISLEAVGVGLGVTRERVRQIEQDALLKLKKAKLE